MPLVVQYVLASLHVTVCWLSGEMYVLPAITDVPVGQIDIARAADVHLHRQLHEPLPQSFVASLVIGVSRVDV